jgi:hypothetical protein
MIDDTQRIVERIFFERKLFSKISSDFNLTSEEKTQFQELSKVLSSVRITNKLVTARVSTVYIESKRDAENLKLTEFLSKVSKRVLIAVILYDVSTDTISEL